MEHYVGPWVGWEAQDETLALVDNDDAMVDQNQGGVAEKLQLLFEGQFAALVDFA